MGRLGWVVAATIFTMALTGFFDENKKPVFGSTTGQPVNCRAYVQVSIDRYRDKTFSAEETMNGLQRNCGYDGHAWIDKR